MSNGRIGFLVGALGVLLGVLAVVAALLVRANDSTPGAVGPAATIGVGGGSVGIPASDARGGGVAVAIPPGAVAADTQISVASMPSLAGEIGQLAATDTDVWRALADGILEDDASLVDPIFGPAILAAFAEFTGPMLDLQPHGLTFAAPVEITVPLAVLDLPPDAVPVVLHSGTAGWELVPGSVVDPAAGVLRFAVTHFSSVSIGSILSNILWNPTASVSGADYRAALDALYAGPTPAVGDAVLRALLCREQVAFDAAARPELDRVLDALGAGSVGIGTAPAGAIDRIKQWLLDYYATSRAEGRPTPHDIGFDQLIGKALGETGGDVFQALLLAHDVLSASRDTQGVQDVMVNVLGDAVPGQPAPDQRGARYHLLGAAVYAFAYEHQRATGGAPWWPPSPETTVRLEEAWVSGDIRTETIEYALDRFGVRLGRQLYQETAAIAAGNRSEEIASLCAGAGTTTTPTSTSTSAPQPETSSTSAPMSETSSTVPPDVVLGTGDVQATLLWSGDTDMDLHVLDPNGEEILFSSPTSSSGGMLDHDARPACGEPAANVENVFWPTGQAPAGEYRAYVHFYSGCVEGSAQSVQLTVRVDGVVVVNATPTLTAGQTSELFLFSVA